MPRHRTVAARATLLVAAVLATACFPGMPRRVAGSDITLPRSKMDEVLRAVVNRCSVWSDSTRTADASASSCSQVSDTTGGRVRETAAKTP